ncbi:hypothetical protein [Phenylobacterium sp.]|uniref:hypothetical protein n=1 Tax=Phenylobacterium sp. TaxID=1871053 RepID=UPI00391CDF4B
MTPAMAELLHRHRRTIAGLDDQIAALRSGAVRYLRGAVDATAEALERAERDRAALQALVDKHDPEGFTKLV